MTATCVHARARSAPEDVCAALWVCIRSALRTPAAGLMEGARRSCVCQLPIKALALINTDPLTRSSLPALTANPEIESQVEGTERWVAWRACRRCRR